MDEYVRNNNLFELEKRKKSFDGHYEKLKEFLVNKDDLESLLDDLFAGGFYYVKDSETIYCYCCNYELILKRGENPTMKHWLEQPNCNHLRTKKYLGPECLNYFPIAARLESFQQWPVGMTQKKQDMSEAGFIYTGIGDRVICFCCNSVLKFWEIDDLPWVEHARWVPTCQYVIIKQGIEFIDNVHREIEKNEVEIRKRQRELKNCEKSLQIEDVNKDNRCCVCYTRLKSTCFEPCGHNDFCFFCAFTSNICMICKSQIERRVRLNW